jgi:hypothetical protein
MVRYKMTADVLDDRAVVVRTLQRIQHLLGHATLQDQLAPSRTVHGLGESGSSINKGIVSAQNSKYRCVGYLRWRRIIAASMLTRAVLILRITSVNGTGGSTRMPNRRSSLCRPGTPA